MRILHVITTLGRGGAEAHLYELIREQIRQGHTVACAYLKERPAPDWADALAQLGVRVTPLGLKFYGDPAPVLRLRRLMREFSPDVVHAHLQAAELYCRLALVGLPAQGLVISRHNLQIFVREDSGNILSRWCVNRAGRVICISEAAAHFLEKENPTYDRAAVAVIPYSIDLSAYDDATFAGRDAVRTALGIPSGAFVYGTVSRMIASKRVDVLIDAFAALDDNSADYLVVVGDGPELADLKARAAATAVSDRILFTGERRDIPALMAAFDLFVFASVTEGFGLVILEAMAARQATVVSDLPPMSGLVLNEETGLTVAPGDVSGFAAAMGRLRADPGLRGRLGVAGRARAEKYSVQAMVESTVAVYSNAVGSRAARDL